MTQPSPVTYQRLQGLLHARNISWQEGPGGELVVVMPSLLTFLRCEDDGRLQVRSQWRGKVASDEDFSTLAGLVLDCNAQRHGPKAYMLALSEGVFTLATERSIFSSNGLDDDQLADFFDTSLAMEVGFTAEVQGELAHLVEWEEKEAQR